MAAIQQPWTEQPLWFRLAQLRGIHFQNIDAKIEVVIAKHDHHYGEKYKIEIKPPIVESINAMKQRHEREFDAAKVCLNNGALAQLLARQAQESAKRQLQGLDIFGRHRD